MTNIRIGIDVGGTNTDAVAIEADGTVVAWHKAPTTPDISTGINQAVRAVTEGLNKADVGQVMLGTTHPVNAIIRRNGLARVGVLRIGAPATLAVLPLVGWPEDLTKAIQGPTAVIRGGHEYDGREINPLDEDAVLDFAKQCASTVDAIALTSTGSPMNDDHERRAAALIASVLGEDFSVTIGSEVAGIGVIERENTAVLNAALSFIGRHIVSGVTSVLRDIDLRAELFLTQNDGTLLIAEEAIRCPILTVGSGPTNSMRGAAYLSGLTNAVVVDVGGTSTDVGLLVDGFPRNSAQAVEIGGVRTNFRMPDLISMGLGGGSIVSTEPLSVGPDSVGHRVTEEARIFGGKTLTLSDISVASGRANFGTQQLDSDSVAAEVVNEAIAWVDEQMYVLSDRIKVARGEVPLIAVGGGAHLLPEKIPGISEVLRHEHAGIANAIGAAMAEASGTVDRNYVYSNSSREACIAEAKANAIESAIRAGADPNNVRITTVNEIPMSYMPGDCARLVVKAVGSLVVN